MYEQIVEFRRKLAAGNLCIGPGISFSDPAVTEALAPTMDFVWIDLEHTPIGLEALQAHLIAARAGGAAPLVRVPSSDTAWIKRVLDIGAEGLIVPQVSSAAEVEGIVRDSRYTPDGARGFGPRRPSNYGRLSGIEYLRDANEKIFVAAQIENMAAVEDLDAILRVPGLDSIVIGPWDLSASMGRPGDVFSAEVQSVIRDVITRSRAASRFVGIGMLPDARLARDAAEMGAQWIQCGGDCGYMVAFADRLVAEIRGAGAK